MPNLVYGVRVKTLRAEQRQVNRSRPPSCEINPIYEWTSRLIRSLLNGVALGSTEPSLPEVLQEVPLRRARGIRKRSAATYVQLELVGHIGFRCAVSVDDVKDNPLRVVAAPVVDDLREPRWDVLADDVSTPIS